MRSGQWSRAEILRIFWSTCFWGIAMLRLYLLYCSQQNMRVGYQFSLTILDYYFAYQNCQRQFYLFKTFILQMISQKTMSTWVSITSIFYKPLHPATSSLLLILATQIVALQLYTSTLFSFINNFKNKNKMEDLRFPACYTLSETKIQMERPGIPRPLPDYLLKEIRQLFPMMKKYQSFIGGHPVSITRQSLTQIFTSLNCFNQSPYLVCEKSDGVRYLLIIARVTKNDLVREPEFEQPLYTQCYFVSRKGHNTLQSFVVDVGISFDMDIPSSQSKDNDRKYIVSILDGELVQQFVNQKQIFRYLMFDGLVHLGRNICKTPLRERLECVTRFVHCNEMLGKPSHKIGIQLKDFYRLTCRKFNVMEFMLQKYVKMMQHKYDGIIFNHQEKEYIVGATNNGYIKWKPEELNTVDFVIVPNLNLEDRFGKRILDLYVGFNDTQLNRYIRMFYAFTVIDEGTFSDLQRMLRQKEEEKFRLAEQRMTNQDFTVIDEFAGAIIAECRYQTTKSNERPIMSQLSRESRDELRTNLMKQGDEQRDNKSLDLIKKKIYDKNWKIYKIREDKSLPNNIETVKKIEDSIRDGISFEELLKKGKEINDRVFC